MQNYDCIGTGCKADNLIARIAALEQERDAFRALLVEVSLGHRTEADWDETVRRIDAALAAKGGVMDDPSSNGMRSAMSMAAMLLNGATFRRNGSDDKWVLTAIYRDGRVSMTRERDGFSQMFAPQVIPEQFSRIV